MPSNFIMATPFINAVGPTNVDSYQVDKPRHEQSSNIPGTFLDAMDVRIPVFATEQNVPVELEFDTDDSRARHWVVYASVNKTESPQVLADDGVTVLQARRSSTATVPIGTVRVIPFPHGPHPQPGHRYADNFIDGGQPDDAPESPTTWHTKMVQAPDRKTSLHDGVEPYVKMGRLAVLKEFRRLKLATLLIKTALGWLRENPHVFDASVSAVGLAQLGVGNDARIPQWKGLVCIHAQTTAVPFWEKLGFVQDEEMGTWWEAGIPHVGMFHRIKISNEIRVVR